MNYIQNILFVKINSPSHKFLFRYLIITIDKQNCLVYNSQCQQDMKQILKDLWYKMMKGDFHYVTRK